MQSKHELIEALKNEISESQDNNPLRENDKCLNLILSIVDKAAADESANPFELLLTNVKIDLKYSIEQLQSALKVVKKFEP